MTKEEHKRNIQDAAKMSVGDYVQELMRAKIAGHKDLLSPIEVVWTSSIQEFAAQTEELKNFLFELDGIKTPEDVGEWQKRRTEILSKYS